MAGKEQAFEEWREECAALILAGWNEEGAFRFALAGLLEAAGVENAAKEAMTFMRDNPGIHTESTPKAEAEEWLAAAADAAGWKDPARYGAS